MSFFFCAPYPRVVGPDCDCRNAEAVLPPKHRQVPRRLQIYCAMYPAHSCTMGKTAGKDACCIFLSLFSQLHRFLATSSYGAMPHLIAWRTRTQLNLPPKIAPLSSIPPSSQPLGNKGLRSCLNSHLHSSQGGKKCLCSSFRITGQIPSSRQRHFVKRLSCLTFLPGPTNCQPFTLETNSDS